MSSEGRSRTAALEEALDGAMSSGPTSAGDGSPTLPSELFAVVDLLDTQPALRRALTDPGSTDDRRQGLVHSVLDGKVSEAAVGVVATAAGLRWPGGRALVDAIEQQAVRAELRVADSQGRLDEVEDELFRFSRTVASDPGLQAAITDRTAPVERRRGLVAGLLEGRAAPETSALAQRAVAARERSFAITLERYVEAAAALRQRTIATVRVARPLEGDQTDRLRQALSAQVGREVALQVIVDPGVLGGVRVELGDEIIDGTVSGKLTEVRRLFS